MLLVFVIAGSFCLHLGNFDSYDDMLDLIKICLSRSLLTWVGDLVHRGLGGGLGAPLVSLMPGARSRASYCRVGSPLTVHKRVCACVCMGMLGCVQRCMHDVCVCSGVCHQRLAYFGDCFEEPNFIFVHFHN